MSEAEQRLDQLRELQNQSSMDYWWPLLESVDVPTPETVQLEIADTQEFQDGLALPVPNEEKLHEAIKAVDGPPAFLRSDVTSRKHRMTASRIDETDPIAGVVAGVVEQHHLAMGMPMPSSWYVREWLELYHEFEGWAYNHYEYGTPVAAELRYYLLDGEVYDFAFYWPKEAIVRPNHDDWEERWTNTRNKALANPLQRRSEMFAQKVGETFTEGYWSCDFALTKDEEWYAIDMARGELSWHPEGMEQAVSDPRNRTLVAEGGER